MATEHSNSRHHRIADAVAHAVLQGASVESQSSDQAVVVNHSSNTARFLFCLLFWWPGFMFGHHKTTTRQMIRVDEGGGVRIDQVPNQGGAVSIPSHWGIIIAAIIVAAIIIGVCASALEDATDINCRSTMRCDDAGNCTYVTDCD